MKNNVFIFLLILSFASANAMEKKRKFDMPSKWEINKKEKLNEDRELASWQGLPVELKSYILSFVPKYRNAQEILQSLMQITPVNKEIDGLVKSMVYDSETAINVARKYIDENPLAAYSEFILAITMNRLHIVKFLLNGGICLNDRNNNCPILVGAIWDRKNKIVKLLLGAGANVNSRNGLTGSALETAILRQEHAIVQMLIEAGANVNVMDKSGKKILNKALSMGNKEIAQLLIDAGAVSN